MLLIAIVFITLALVFYTLGVWWEKLRKKLTAPMVAVFWAGFTCDTVGTLAMERIAGGAFKFNFHGITGLAAILLMLVHAVWASIVLARRDERAKRDFHRFSLVVWLVWLIPYLSGMIVGVNR